MSYDSPLYQQHVQHLLKFAKNINIKYHSVAWYC